jgi:hypothetical protein
VFLNKIVKIVSFESAFVKDDNLKTWKNLHFESTCKGMLNEFFKMHNFKSQTTPNRKFIKR